MQYAVKIVISLIPVCLFFAYYYRNFVFHKSLVWLSRSIFIGILSSSAAILIQQLLPPTGSPLLKAFLYAAFVEEAVRYVIIRWRIGRRGDDFTVVEGVFDSILIGLGFAFAENLHYALNFSGYIILLRSVSSVPMHAFASGIMGYFISYRHLVVVERDPLGNLPFAARRRTFLAAMAFLVPFLFHGMFDYSLFRGGVWNYLMPLVLLGGFGLLEYCIARARFIPGRNILGIINIDADDMEVLDRQKDYEKWIDSAQDEDPEPLTLFKNEWSLFTTISAGLLIVPALGMLALFLSGSELFPTGRGIEAHTLVALLVLLPLSLGSILILAEKINYLYLREYMIRLPGGGKVDIQQNGEEEPFLVLDILPWGVFLSDAEDLRDDRPLEADFYYSDGTPLRVGGRIVWMNRTDHKLPVGAILRFHNPGFSFAILRWIYIYGKIKHRIVYNWNRRKREKTA